MLSAVFAGALLIGGAAASHAASDVPAYIQSAVSDASRPDADKKRDADRKPGEMLVIAEIKPGQKVADFFPGRGYFTRIFAKSVGASGKVYAVVPAEELKDNPKSADGIKAVAAEPGYANVAVVSDKMVDEFKLPEQVDVVWTSQNYHDLHDATFVHPDMAKFNKAVFDALKPGGLFIVLDHSAVDGSGFRDAGTLHRADKEAVKKEVMAAGFKLVGESSVLKNPADDRTKKVFDADVRSHTDQFILKFKK
jgi:predicted methyltransferase